MNKNGRNKKSNAKIRRINLRIDEDDADKLADLCMETDMSVSEVIRFAIRLYYRYYFS